MTGARSKVSTLLVFAQSSLSWWGQRGRHQYWGALLESLPPCGQPQGPETALKPGGPKPQPGLPSAESAGAQNLPCGRVNDFVSLAFM